MGGSGVMDFMVKSYRSNRRLLKGGKKSLRKIYQENSLHYVKRRVAEKTRHFDEEQKQIFLERFHRRQRKTRQKRVIFFIIFILVFGSLLFLVLGFPNVR